MHLVDAAQVRGDWRSRNAVVVAGLPATSPDMAMPFQPECGTATDVAVGSQWLGVGALPT